MFNSVLNSALLYHIFCCFLFSQSCSAGSLGDEADRPERWDVRPSSQVALQENQRLSDIISASPLLSFHRSLCETESISGNESTVGNYLVGYLRSHGFGVLRQEVEPEGEDGEGSKRTRFNVFAWPRGNGSGQVSTDYDLKAEGEMEKDDQLGDFIPKVILSSHIDTVPPFIPFSLSYPSTEKNRDELGKTEFNRSQILIHGRGTVDAKACVAAQTHAVLSLLTQSNTRSQPLPVALLFVVSEETLGSGMKTFSASPLHKHLSAPSSLTTTSTSQGYKTVIFGEPTESRLASGHKGLFAFSLVALGRAAHSGYPWLGVNANNLLIDAVARIARLGDIPVAEGGLARSEKYGNSTVNVGMIRGGVAINVVSERAEARVAVRLAGGEVEEARDVIRRAVRRTAKENGVEFREGGRQGHGHTAETGLLLEFFGPAYSPVDLDTDLLDDGNGDGDELFGKPITVNYGTDVPNLTLQKKGVRRYLYGPGSILVAHGPREGLTVRDLEDSVRGYRKLIEDALSR